MMSMWKKAAATMVVVCGGASVYGALAMADSNVSEGAGEAQSVSLASAFPSLRPAVPAEARNGSTVVASASLVRSDGQKADLTANDDGTMCFVTEDAGTCAPAEQVGKRGLFLAKIDCERGRVSLFGVTPQGANVSRVVAPGAQADTKSSSGGVVTIELSGLHPTTVELSNGAGSSMPFDDKMCAVPPKAP